MGYIFIPAHLPGDGGVVLPLQPAVESVKLQPAAHREVEGQHPTVHGARVQRRHPQAAGGGDIEGCGEALGRCPAPRPWSAVCGSSRKADPMAVI